MWNKIARIVKNLDDTLNISNERALEILNDSENSSMLQDEKYGLHLMSDTYIINDLIAELRNKQ